MNKIKCPQCKIELLMEFIGESFGLLMYNCPKCKSTLTRKKENETKRILKTSKNKIRTNAV